MLAPDAGQAIGLQFELHRQRIGLAWAGAAAGFFDLRGNAELLLNVVTDFMRDDVGLGELARRLETLFQLAEEDEVDINLLVARAVKRPHRRLAGAAGGGRHAGKEDQLGFLVGMAAGAKGRIPGVFGRGEHLRDEARGAVVGGWALCRSALLDGRHAATAQHVEHGERIDAEEIAGDQRNDDGAQAHAPATQAQSAATTAAAVFEVVAFALVIHAHGVSP